MASSYQYVELAAAVQGPEGRHHIYAYVAECSAPRGTRGTGARRAPELCSRAAAGVPATACRSPPATAKPPYYFRQPLSLLPHD